MIIILALFIGISLSASLVQPLRSRYSLACLTIILLVSFLGFYYSSAAPSANDILAYKDVFYGYNNTSLDPAFISLLQFLNSLSVSFEVILFLSPFLFLLSLLILTYTLLPYFCTFASSFSSSSYLYTLFLTGPLFYTSLRQENLFYLIRENISLSFLFLSLSLLASRKITFKFRIIPAFVLFFISFSLHQLVVSITILLILFSILIAYAFHGFSLRFSPPLLLSYSIRPQNLLLLLLPLVFLIFLQFLPYLLQLPLFSFALSKISAYSIYNSLDEFRYTNLFSTPVIASVLLLLFAVFLPSLRALLHDSLAFKSFVIFLALVLFASFYFQPLIPLVPSRISTLLFSSITIFTGSIVFSLPKPHRTIFLFLITVYSSYKLVATYLIESAARGFWPSL